MGDLCRLIWCGLIGLFRPRAALEAENLVLRHQLNVLRRKSPNRVALGCIDRLVLVALYRLAPGVLDALKIIRPVTLIPLAPCRLPSLLVLEVPTARWPTDDSGGHSRPHSRNKYRQPALGRSPDTR